MTRLNLTTDELRAVVDGKLKLGRLPWGAAAELLAERRGHEAVRKAVTQKFVEGKGPFFTNRALDRPNRGAGHGYGEMAPSVKSRRS